jgi:hypothetical protein
VVFLQEPYSIRNRSAVIINNNIDAVAIKQLSDDDDATLNEFSYKHLNSYGASLYFAIDRDFERDTGKVEEIIELTRGKCLIIS